MNNAANIIDTKTYEIKTKDGRMLKLNIVEALTVLAIDGLQLKNFETQTHEMCYTAIKQNPEAFRYVQEQTEDLCILAVQLEGWLLDVVEKQNHAICMAAVKEDGNALQFVRQQNTAMCLSALNQNRNAIDFIKDRELKNRLKMLLRENLGGLKNK